MRVDVLAICLGSARNHVHSMIISGPVPWLFVVTFSASTGRYSLIVSERRMGFAEYASMIDVMCIGRNLFSLRSKAPEIKFL